jgi:hypothetical protein
VPIQRVLGKLAAVPHFSQLRLFVRPASLALHVNVDVHGFSLPSWRNRQTIKSSLRIRKLFWSPRGRKYAHESSSQPIIGDSLPLVNCNRRHSFAEGSRRPQGDGYSIASRACKLRGGPKISRRMIASRKPDFDASKVAMSVFNSAPFAIGRVAAA